MAGVLQANHLSYSDNGTLLPDSVVISSETLPGPWPKVLVHGRGKFTSNVRNFWYIDGRVEKVLSLLWLSCHFLRDSSLEMEDFTVK
jgi:hypothetical protein